jgi:hypothetical protein
MPYDQEHYDHPSNPKPMSILRDKLSYLRWKRCLLDSMKMDPMAVSVYPNKVSNTGWRVYLHVLSSAQVWTDDLIQAVVHDAYSDTRFAEQLGNLEVIINISFLDSE